MRYTSTVAMILIVALAIPVVGSAQEIMKHPRVVELEDRLNRDASEYIKARFPQIPFMVTVSVDPLRRDTAKIAGGQEELPFFDEDDEEIKDEWDNPQVPLMALINRVKKVQVNISIPSKLKETEVNELKEGIFSILHLTPARDRIEIARRDWALDEVPWTSVYVIAGVMTALLLGLLGINRTSANRIAKALTDMKMQNAASAPAAVPPPSMTDSESKGSRRSQSQEVKFNDPIKMKELATRHIEFLTNSKIFPNHQDIFILDELGREHPEKLGAILSEFPAEMQKTLFAYSSHFHWIEALNEPGFLDFECLEVLQSMTQNLREGDDLEWDHAVLSVWRLNESRTQFIKSLPKDEAFALLNDMPKAIAVFEARKAFPGSWAAILDAAFKPARPNSKRIREIQESAWRIMPLNDIAMVKRYKSERELLDYLRFTDPTEERDIYGAAASSSLIHKLRPPFFPVFDQPSEAMATFVAKIPTDQWALALFNLPRPERAKVDMHFSEKQRFLLVDRFKRFDVQTPEPSAVGLSREKIGAALQRFLNDKVHMPKSDHGENNSNDSEAENEKSKAA
jgi:hypothetical protein